MHPPDRAALRLLMVAPPGAGKGTQAERLSARYGVEHIASGELLRREISSGSDIGRRAAGFVDSGDLVPDEVVLDMVAARLVEAVQGAGYVLDGWPRNQSQAEAAYELARQFDGVTLQVVLHLEVERQEVIRRMRARADAEGRSDDTASTITHRLEVYDRQTEPLLDFYRSRGILATVDGGRTPDEVAESIVAALVRAGVVDEPTTAAPQERP